MERSGASGATPEALSARALERLEARDTGRASVLRTLLYEEVRDGAALERHLEHFATRHPLVSVGRVLATFEGGHALPPRALLLAFRNPASFAARAWPVLRRRGCAAVLFVAPRHLAGGEPSRAEALRGDVRRDLREDIREDLEELRRLAGEGVALGLSEEPAPVDPGHAGWRRALETLEEIAPGAARVLLHAHPRPDAARVSSAHAAGFELAFVPLPGSADLRWADPLRLRSLPADAHDALGLLRARLALSAPRNRGAWAPPPSREERVVERARRARRARLRFVLRPLDALLTAGIVPRPAPAAALRALVRRRSSNYERLRHLARLTVGAVPPLERALRRALLDGTRLPVRSGLELAGHGTAATVFRLAEPPHSPQVLKVYRWTLGHPAREQAQMVRRHRARYRRLREWFGARLLATHYLVLHGPLLGLPVAGCLQERVERATDLFARADGDLLELLRARPGAASEFKGFVRQLLAVRALGFFPDLLGPGNLLLVEDGERARIRLVDYGLFDLRCGTAHLPLAAIEETTRRCARLAHELGGADSP